MSSKSAATAPALLPKWSDNDSAQRLHAAFTRSDFNAFTSLEHVSRSGMARDIVLYASTGDLSAPLAWLSRPAADVLGWSMRSNKYGIRVSGAGMDMGFHLVYSLSAALYGDGYALTQRWL